MMGGPIGGPALQRGGEDTCLGGCREGEVAKGGVGRVRVRVEPKGAVYAPDKSVTCCGTEWPGAGGEAAMA